MSIIFNELEYAQQVEKENITTTYNAIKKGTLLAKMYFDLGNTEQEVYNKLAKKFTILDNCFNYNIKHHKLQIMIKAGKNKANLTNKPLQFSVKELEFIRKINNLDIEKVLFVMLCISKLFNNSSFFASCEEIMAFSKVKNYTAKKNEVFGYLFSNKLISMEIKMVGGIKMFEKAVYNVCDEITSLFDENEIALSIDKFENLGYYYMMYYNIGKFLFCKECGNIDLKANNRQEYCNKHSRKRLKNELE